jgi:metallo-beta-lactamase family protein
MKLTFLGAAGMVTGSRHLVETGRTRILLDCGLHQGGHDAPAQNREAFGFDPRQLDAVVLSHAHIDHSGLLPRLWREGYRGPVYATAATAELAALLLKDSAHLQQADYERHQRRGRRAEPPLYSRDDVDALLSLFQPLPYGDWHSLGKDARVRLHEAGHILGASVVELSLGPPSDVRTLVFSGDLGQPGRPILRDAERLLDADVLLLESTYGDRLHKSQEATVDELVAIVSRTLIGKHGNLIVPAFAVGRTQELLYWFERLTFEGRLPALDIFVDSPLGTEVTALTRRHQELYDEEARALYRAVAARGSRCHVRFTHSVSESMALNQISGGAVIIASSGMCEGGRIRHHLRHHLSNSHTTVMFTGFQAKGTLGRQLIEGLSSVYIDGRLVQVRAEVATLGGFSAHADQAALLDWLRGFKPLPSVWLVHGEPEASSALSLKIEAVLGAPVAGIASYGQTVEF